MSTVLGLDTSNYTTSVAVWENGTVTQQKRLLPVEAGQRGLRQNDAVFHHVQALPMLAEALLAEVKGPVSAVGVSERPTEREGSYMPCFTVGVTAARLLAAAWQVPLLRFTHQQGHVAAALYGADRLDLMDKPFLAFHVSGGTTEALAVEPGIHCHTVAQSKDLKAGQLIDRVGVMLGLPFPAGAALERLAQEAQHDYSPRPSMEGGDCHLSGVENQCRAMWEKGASSADVARFCLRSVEAALSAMSEELRRRFPQREIIYAGGVMSNALLKQTLSRRFGGQFAPPMLSADNAAGIAVLTAMAE